MYCAVPQYRNMSAIVNLQVAGKRCQTSRTILWDCTVMKQCAFSTSLVVDLRGGGSVDFRTLYDHPFGSSAGPGRVFINLFRDKIGEFPCLLKESFYELHDR